MKEKPIQLSYAAPQNQGSKPSNCKRWYKYEFRPIDVAIYIVIVLWLIHLATGFLRDL